MKTLLRTDSQTIILQGTVEQPTPEDMQRVQKIRDELKAKHADEGGLIVHQSSKKSGYRQLKISWRSKPELTPND